MKVKFRFLTAIWLGLPVILFALAATIRPAPGQTNAGQNASRLAQMKSLFVDKCSACHDLPKPEQFSYTRDDWQKTVSRMLTKYKASESISTAEAAEIVDYLATFSAKAAAPTEAAAGPWASEADDIPATFPSQSFTATFASPDDLKRMASIAGGDRGAHFVWRVIPVEVASRTTGVTSAGVARVSGAGCAASSFGLLESKVMRGLDVDLRVQFKIVSGKSSPAVGIAFGLQGANVYDVVRYNQATHDIALIHIKGLQHTTIQQTPFVPDAKSGPWHTLRVYVKNGTVRAWIDTAKLIRVADPSYTAGGVALWSQGDTVAEFSTWTVDVLDATAP